nr:amidohydrolase family protein [Halobacillus sp. Marseille-P3879]
MKISEQTYVALMNGKIITVDDQDCIEEAVLLVGDRIAAVGTNQEIHDLLPTNGTAVDLGGRSVIPGIVDSHVHTELTVNSLTNAVSAHTPPYTSVEQILNVIKERVDHTPKGKWVIARGSNALPEKLKEARLPTRQELDRIAPENPIIFNMEVHVNIMNTMAIEKMGWTQESWLPNGATLGRDYQTGELTGVFTEGWEGLPLMPWGYEKLLDALRVGTVEHFVSKGVTSVHELPYSTDGIRAWQQLQRQGDLPLRLRLYLQHPNLTDIDQIINTGLQSGFGDEWLSLGGIKLFVDGQGIHANLHPVFDSKYTQE